MPELHDRIVEIGRANPPGPRGAPFYLRQLDYSVLQQCIHCGMCLPTCPTYDETKLERNSPRGRIALMRSIAEGALDVTRAFGDEMYFCLGCLACETVCPAGVNYAEMFENARADIERAGVLKNPQRTLVRALTLRWIFTRPRVLRALGRLLYFYQKSGLEKVVRTLARIALLPRRWRELETLTPRVCREFSDALIAPVEPAIAKKYRVGMLTGCVQDLTFSDVNRDTVDALRVNGCEVATPRAQFCCGSLHAHNGELELAREMARRNIDSFDLHEIDAIISNAAGCGSHLKNYAHLLRDDPTYAERAAIWSAKLRDVHEWLVEIGLRAVDGNGETLVTYHEACHLCHAQKISSAPREVMRAVRDLRLIELPEATWCCGSAGVYNITQPEMSQKLLLRKVKQIVSTGASIVASANPGCTIQLRAGLREQGNQICVAHPISLLAEAYREAGWCR